MADYVLKRKIEQKLREVDKFGKTAKSSASKGVYGEVLPMIKMCCAQYSRISRVIAYEAKETDIKRVYSGDVQTTTLQDLLNQSNTVSVEAVERSYRDASENPRGLRSRMQLRPTLVSTSQSPEQRSTIYAKELAIASNKPAAINLLAGLHLGVATDRAYRNGLEKAVTVLGVASTAASELVPGFNVVSKAATYLSSSSLLPKSHDDQLANMELFSKFVDSWSSAANQLITRIDPNGEWVFEDFFDYSV